MASFYRVVVNHRLYHVVLLAVVTENGNVIFVNPFLMPLFGRFASFQCYRPHESAFTIKLRNYICHWKIILFRMTKYVYENYFLVLTYGMVLLFLCETDVWNLPLVHEFSCKLRYTGCPRRNVKYFGRVFLMLNYTDIAQNTYIQS